MKSALVFGGQGKCFFDVSKELCYRHREAKMLFGELSERFCIDILKLCYEAETEKKNSVYNRQICTFAIEYVKYKIFIKKHKIDAVAGFSLGEYMALLASGIISTEQACELVSLRAKLFNDYLNNCLGDMLAVFNISVEQVGCICSNIGKDIVDVSNYNSYEQVVVSGTKCGLEQFKINAKLLGGKIVPLNMERPYHHALMRDIAQEFYEKLKDYEFSQYEIPIVMNLHGNVLTKIEDVKEYMYKQIFSPVKWIETVQTMQGMNIQKYYEIGTSPILLKFIKNIAHITDEEISVV